MDARDLLDAVERAFAVTGRGLAPWPDPHPDRSPAQDEYSRVSDPLKWRIIGARADAWVQVLAESGLADVERDANVRWLEAPRTHVTATDRAVPRARGALPLVVGRSAVGGVDGAGVTFGVGDPAVVVAWLPECGCDACDSGSQDELDQVDQLVLGVASGTFRRLTRAGRQITRLDDSGWSASGDFRRGEVEAVLADSTGWDEVSGAPWR